MVDTAVKKNVDIRTPLEKSIAARKQAFQETLVSQVIQHEGLAPFQTPFRITHPSMNKWTSMFDDTIKLPLDKKTPKPKGRENFLFVKKQEDVPKGINEWFKRRAVNPKKYGMSKDVTIAEAMAQFDQSGLAGKLLFLTKSGVDINTKLKEIY